MESFLTHFAHKKPRPSDSKEKMELASNSDQVPSDGAKWSKMDDDGDMPSCWTRDQKNEFCKKYDWLYVRNKKLGCKLCRRFRALGPERTGLKVAKEWANNEITHYGESRQQQLTSLRKKLFEHKETAAHKAALNLTAEVDRQIYDVVTASSFNNAHEAAKENQSFSDFEPEVILQELSMHKKARLSDELTDEVELPSSIVDAVSSDIRGEAIDEAADRPSCWTLDQKNEFCKKYDWLYVRNKKLGCRSCRQVAILGAERTGFKVAKEWANNEITHFGESRQQQMMSLRKKLFDHKETAAHKAALKLVTDVNQETFEDVTTAKIFRTAYKVAKENQPFNDFESEIDLQELNGIGMGRILRSTNACINIVNHVGDEMRKNLGKHVARSRSRISLILDETTSLGKKTTMIVYVRTLVGDCGMNAPVNMFLDLIELQSVTAKGIVFSLLTCLQSCGLTEEYLKSYLVCVTCDGTSALLGSNSGVSKILKDKFPSLIVWHCANYRLELAVGDAVKAVSGCDRFKAFVDKFYVLYRTSPKSSRELQMCVSLLEAQLFKVGQVLTTHWVASSFRSVSAVWENYEALVRHFEEAMTDATRAENEKCMYEGLLQEVTSREFVLDLGLMCDALQELFELNLDLQERSIDLYRANEKIKMVVQIFNDRRTVSGPYHECAMEAAENLCFEGVSLHDCQNDLPIDPDAFYKRLKGSIEKMLLGKEDADLAQWARVLDQTQRPEDIDTQVAFGETEINNLSVRLRLMCENLMDMSLPEKMMYLKHMLSTVPISSSECERGLLQMNLILSPTRTELMTKILSALLFVQVVGPPVSRFEPTKYIESWLLRRRRSIVNGKERSLEIDENLMKIWNFL